MTTPNQPLPTFKTSESFGRLLRGLNAWTGGKSDTLLKRMLRAWLESPDSQDLPADLRTEAEGFLLRTGPSRTWVVYEHHTPDGAVVYVGKGRPARAWSRDRADPEHTARLVAQELHIVLVRLDLTEADALAEESRLIGERLAAGHRLYNRSIPPSGPTSPPGVTRPLP